MAHVLPPPAGESDLGLAEWIEERLLPLRGLAPEEQARRVASYWDELDAAGRTAISLADISPIDKAVDRLTLLILKSGNKPKIPSKR